MVSGAAHYLEWTYQLCFCRCVSFFVHTEDIVAYVVVMIAVQSVRRMFVTRGPSSTLGLKRTENTTVTTVITLSLRMSRCATHRVGRTIYNCNTTTGRRMRRVIYHVLSLSIIPRRSTTSNLTYTVYRTRSDRSVGGLLLGDTVHKHKTSGGGKH